MQPFTPLTQIRLPKPGKILNIPTLQHVGMWAIYHNIMSSEFEIFIQFVNS